MADARTASYRPAECCGAADCDFLGADPAKPCWGQVEVVDAGIDEDGDEMTGHACQGHRDHWEFVFRDHGESYYPEPPSP